jgi:hypothetical protein
MHRHYDLMVRLFLAIPVTPDRCFVKDCNGVTVHPYGAHGNHCSDKIIYRHNRIRDKILQFLRYLTQSYGLSKEVFREQLLENYDVKKKVDAPDQRSTRCDIVVVDDKSYNYNSYIDVIVIHPVPKSGTQSNPMADLQEAERQKYDRYLKNWHLAKPQVVPLAFETTGAWSERTVEFLQSVIKSIAGEDNALFNKLWRLLRNWISITLAKGEGAILNWLKRSNHVPGDYVATNSSASAPEELDPDDDSSSEAEADEARAASSEEDERSNDSDPSEAEADEVQSLKSDEDLFQSANEDEQSESADEEQAESEGDQPSQEDSSTGNVEDEHLDGEPSAASLWGGRLRSRNKQHQRQSSEGRA